jgi:hypothetical protein
VVDVVSPPGATVVVVATSPPVVGLAMRDDVVLRSVVSPSSQAASARIRSPDRLKRSALEDIMAYKRTRVAPGSKLGPGM